MRPKVASSIAALLRGLKDPEGLDARRALDLIVRDSGTAYFDFLKHSPPGMNYFRGAEFVEAEEKLYLLLIADSGSSTIPGSEGLLVILLSAEGRALDFGDRPVSYRILLWNDFDREIRGMGGDVCNVGIRGDRLEVLGK